MSDTEKLKARLNLPPVAQIGIVVRDIHRAVEYYSTLFGLGPFTVYEFAPDKHWYMEEPSPIRFQMGKAMLGDIEIELIEPSEGKSHHREILRTMGEGLHHLGFNVPNYEEVFHRFLREGFKPLMRAESYVPTYKGTVRACYFDTSRIGGVLFEIIWKSWLAGRGC
jgi:catechol 2,3-dioxygenase-like lactoylglutathione lyase family enzyme